MMMNETDDNSIDSMDEPTSPQSDMMILLMAAA